MKKLKDYFFIFLINNSSRLKQTPLTPLTPTATRKRRHSVMRRTHGIGYNDDCGGKHGLCLLRLCTEPGLCGCSNFALAKHNRLKSNSGW
jgi:hypothetical protein